MNNEERDERIGELADEEYERRKDDLRDAKREYQAQLQAKLARVTEERDHLKKYAESATEVLQNLMSFLSVNGCRTEIDPANTEMRIRDGIDMLVRPVLARAEAAEREVNRRCAPRTGTEAMNEQTPQAAETPAGAASVLNDGLDAGGKNAHIMRVMSSSEDMTWATPQEWFDYLNLEFGFTLDPCCWPDTAKCKRYYTPDTDGLAQSWQDERVFMNPPYGRELGKWMKKAYEEARDNGALVVCFVPARVDTNWWHNYAAKATEVRFPKGRVKNPTGIAWPFPLAVVVFRPKL